MITVVPDFGMHEVYFEGTRLTCKYRAPGLTMQDIVRIFGEAENDWKPADNISGNPSKWKNSRGISAVVQAVLEAVYASPLAPVPNGEWTMTGNTRTTTSARSVGEAP